jgi:polysaccharide export outer membrane protein
MLALCKLPALAKIEKVGMATNSSLKKVTLSLLICCGFTVVGFGRKATSQVSPTPPAETSVSTTPPNFQTRHPRYQLVPGDVIDLSFEFSPEFNQTATVQPDGYVTLRDVGDFYVAGTTVPQLTTVFESAYAKVLYKPSVAVVIKDFEKPYFVAGGQVAHPGKYVLRGDTTITEAIAMAGGFTDKSKHSQVILVRRVSSEWAETRVLDVKKLLNDKKFSEDLLVKPGDMVFVPQNLISKISRYIPGSGMYVNPTQF